MKAFTSWDHLVETWCGLEAPEGWRPELDPGGIFLLDLCMPVLSP